MGNICNADEAILDAEAQNDYDDNDNGIEEENIQPLQDQPSKLIAFNLNKLPKVEIDKLAQHQQRIAQMLAHQKKSMRPLFVTCQLNQQNRLPDPYYIRSMNAIYIGQWVFDATVNNTVPGGVGRLYTLTQIREGFMVTKHSGQRMVDQNQTLAEQLIRESKQRAKFFTSNVGDASKKKMKKVKVEEYIGKQITINVVLQGQGRIFTRNTQYSGFFKNGKLQGKGRIYLKSDSDRYEYNGQFKEGLKNGKGIEQFKLNNYDGDFVEDKKTGKGTLTMMLTCAYERQLKAEDKEIALQDKLRSQTQLITRVQKYIDLKKQYQDKLSAALAQYKWPAPKMDKYSVWDSSAFVLERLRRTKFLQQYKGQFKDNQFHGQGQYVWFNGKCYRGHWNRGKMQGLGQFSWPKGSYFRGQYSNDLKHGKGIMFWNFRNRYRGEWQRGKRQGYGELISIILSEGEIVTSKQTTKYMIVITGGIFYQDQLKQTLFQKKINTEIDPQILQIHEKQLLQNIKSGKRDNAAAEEEPQPPK